MGLPIGQSPATLNAIVGSRRVRAVSLFDKPQRPLLRALGQEEPSEKLAIPSRPQRDRVQFQLREDFGSTPAAALGVVRKTVQETRKLIPTISESQIGLRRQAAESRLRLREAFHDQNAGSIGSRGSAITDETTFFDKNLRSRIEVQIPEASSIARNFINALNETASATQLKLSGDEPAPTGGASFQVNGQTFSIANGSTGFNLNVQV